MRQQTVDGPLEEYDEMLKRSEQNMTYIDASISLATSIITPQFHHRKAVEQHEKAIKHHRQAALLFDAGDKRQAQTHANIALSHAVAALETGSMALKI